MDDLDAEGMFWIAGQQEKAVIGRLTYSPSDGGYLKMYGAFIDLDTAFAPVVKPIRILGAAGGRELTLEGCYHAGTKLQSIETHEYRVLRVLSGAYFDPDGPLEFDEVAVSFDQLAYWVQKTGLSLEMTSMNPQVVPSEVTKIDIKYEVIPPEMVSLDDIDLSLTFDWGLGGDRLTIMRVNQETHLKIKYSSLKPLDEILTDVYGLQDLITLASDTPTVSTEIKLWNPSVTRGPTPDSQTQVPMSLHIENMAAHVAGGKPQSSGSMFFPFDQIGGLEVVGRWIAVSRKYRLVLGSLLTVKYAVRLYAENRYYNVISAAETLHRMCFPNEVRPANEYKSFRRKIVKSVKTVLGPKTSKWLHEQLLYSNEPRLRARLIELADYAGETFHWLVGDVQLWATMVTKARNRMTHHDEKQRIGVNYEGMYRLTDSIYILVMLCLLQECQISAEALTHLKTVPRIDLLHMQLEKITSDYRESGNKA